MTVGTADARLDAAIERIVGEFHPLKIILFGSRARGDAREDSDYDLLVVMPGAGRRFALMGDVLESLAGLPIAADVIVAFPGELARPGRRTIAAREALREGRVVYERS